MNNIGPLEINVYLYLHGEMDIIYYIGFFAAFKNVKLKYNKCSVSPV